MKFEQSNIVGIRQIGFKNEMSNYGILSFFEDVSGIHSDSIGYGINDIQTKKVAWLLMDWTLKVFKRPKCGEKVLARTWAIRDDKPSYQVFRKFDLRDEKGDLFATATSKWILFSLETNKITKISTEISELYKPEENSKDVQSDIIKLKEPSSYDSVLDYKIRRADIDINQHLHNLNYLNLAYEILPENVYNNSELNNVHIMYKHQIKYGETVKCFYKFENNKQIVWMKSNDEKILHSIIELY